MSTAKKKPTREAVRYARARLEEIFKREEQRLKADFHVKQGQLAKLKSATMDMLVLPNGTDELKDVIDTFEAQCTEFEIETGIDLDEFQRRYY